MVFFCYTSQQAGNGKLLNQIYLTIFATQLHVMDTFCRYLIMASTTYPF